MSQLIRISSPKIYIIDNNISALGTRALLSHKLMGAQFCGVAPRYEIAYDQVGKMTPPPDIVIADINLGVGSRLDGIKQLITLCPNLKILILSAENERLFAVRVLRAGAQGFVSKSAPLEYIVHQVQQVLLGECAVSDEIGKALARGIIGGKQVDVTQSPLDWLSDRELEIFTMLGQVQSTRAISEKLNLSVKTVESHRAHLKKKLGLKNGQELIQYAISVANGRA